MSRSMPLPARLACGLFFAYRKGVKIKDMVLSYFFQY